MTRALRQTRGARAGRVQAPHIFLVIVQELKTLVPQPATNNCFDQPYRGADVQRDGIAPIRAADSFPHGLHHARAGAIHLSAVPGGRGRISRIISRIDCAAGSWGAECGLSRGDGARASVTAFLRWSFNVFDTHR